MDSGAATRQARPAAGRAQLAVRGPVMYFPNGKYMTEEPQCATRQETRQRWSR